MLANQIAIADAGPATPIIRARAPPPEMPAGPLESSGILDLLPDETFHTTHQTINLNGMARTAHSPSEFSRAPPSTPPKAQ